jgi:hypothetical protein
VSQQPYPGQPGQPGQPQPGGYPPPGQQGYPQGGYQQPQQPPQGYGSYQGGPPPGQPSPRPSAGNPLTAPATLAPILLYVGYAVVGLGIIAAIMSLTIDGASGSAKFVQFLGELITSFGFGGILIALAAFLKSRPTT